MAQVIWFICSAHDKIQHLCAPPWLLALLGGRSSRAPGTSVPASGHVPSQHTNETGWHIWEPRHGALKHTSSLQAGNSLSKGTNPIYFSDPTEYTQTKTSPQSPSAMQQWVCYRQWDLDSVHEMQRLSVPFSHSSVCKNIECLSYSEFTRQKYSVFHLSQGKEGVENTQARSWKLQINQPYQLFEIRINECLKTTGETCLIEKNFTWLQSWKAMHLLSLSGQSKHHRYSNVHKSAAASWRDFTTGIWKPTGSTLKSHLAWCDGKKRASLSSIGFL